MNADDTIRGLPSRFVTSGSGAPGVPEGKTELSQLAEATSDAEHALGAANATFVERLAGAVQRDAAPDGAGASAESRLHELQSRAAERETELLTALRAFVAETAVAHNALLSVARRALDLAAGSVGTSVGTSVGSAAGSSPEGGLAGGGAAAWSSPAADAQPTSDARTAPGVGPATGADPTDGHLAAAGHLAASGQAVDPAVGRMTATGPAAPGQTATGPAESPPAAGKAGGQTIISGESSGTPAPGTPAPAAPGPELGPRVTDPTDGGGPQGQTVEAEVEPPLVDHLAGIPKPDGPKGHPGPITDNDDSVASAPDDPDRLTALQHNLDRGRIFGRWAKGKGKRR